VADGEWRRVGISPCANIGQASDTGSKVVGRPVTLFHFFLTDDGHTGTKGMIGSPGRQVDNWSPIQYNEGRKEASWRPQAVAAAGFLTSLTIFEERNVILIDRS
jgi:hypothetical protein